MSGREETSRATDGPSDDAIAGSVLRLLRAEVTGRGCDWWDTDGAGLIWDVARAGPLMTVVAALVEVLRSGDDPDVVVGGRGPRAAFGVAREWLDAGVDPAEVAGWLRTGCWNPTAAKSMVDAGLRPGRLLDDGMPAHWIEASNGQRMPLGQAVAEGFEDAAGAVKIVVGAASPAPGWQPAGEESVHDDVEFTGAAPPTR